MVEFKTHYALRLTREALARQLERTVQSGVESAEEGKKFLMHRQYDYLQRKSKRIFRESVERSVPQSCCRQEQYTKKQFASLCTSNT